MFRDDQVPLFEGRTAELPLHGGLHDDELAAQVESDGDHLLDRWPAVWSHPGLSARSGLLLLSSLGVRFAEEVRAVLRRRAGPTYTIRPESLINFAADFYLGHAVLDLSHPPSGIPLLHVGVSIYQVRDPGAVFDAIYRAKEAAVARAQGLFPPAPRGPPTAATGPTTIVRTVVHEVVKVPCRFCGTLVDLTQTWCPSCGAPLR